MKKLILLISVSIALLLSYNAFSQNTPAPFFSLGASDKGFVVQVGAFYKKFEGQLLFKPAGSGRTTNSIVGVMAGYKLLDWVTPLIGYGYYYRTGFKDYDNDPNGKAAFNVIDGRAILYGVEIRHTWWFVGVSHCDQTFYSVGLKFHKKFKY
ncbi:MAG: hypothetical protein V4560_14885 [Bacteroidota bacterium]